MTSPGGQPATTFPTFVYDGDCAFCSSCARFVERWIPTDAPVVAWQFADLDALGLTIDEVDVAVQWVTSPSDHSAGPDAIADLLKASRWWWRAAGALLAFAPIRAAAWPIYRWISANRDKMPGGTATCALPAADRATD